MAWTKEQKRVHRLTCDKVDCWCSKPRSGKNKSAPVNSIRSFIAIDGEAIGKRGYHLLAASTGDQIEKTTKAGLTSQDCLAFLLDLKKKHGKAIYCGFGLGYDFEHWVRDFGPECWEKLRQEGMEANVRIGHRGIYTIRVFHRKFFKIGCYGSDGRWREVISVFDLFGFFQGSFISTLKSWGVATSEELAIIEAGKADRGAFSKENWVSVVEYNRLECELLVRLAERLREALKSSDLIPRSWHGPGAVCDKLMKRHKMAEHIVAPPPEVQEASRRAYFGGRFQCFRVGHVGRVYDYDLSSAYPWATTLLPSTRGRWQPVDTYQGDESPWCLYRVRWNLRSGTRPVLSPFPWRDALGCIHYPPRGHGWYWGPEVSAAMAVWGDKIAIEEGWRLYPDEEKVFANWLQELAEKRVSAKHAASQSDGVEHYRYKAIERAYKLALNSIYGKTIQTVGNCPTLCPIWAGLVTAFTRARLLDNASRTGIENLVCFATDGLFSASPIPVSPLGSGLGEWELAAEGIDLRIYQSGCYGAFDPDGTLRDTAKFRGLNARTEVDWTALAAEWERNQTAGKVTFKSTRFFGYKMALQHNKPEYQATWREVSKDIVLHPGVGWLPPELSDPGAASLPWLTWWPGEDYSKLSHPHRKLPAGETEEEAWLNETDP